jgi:dienelactone hydrolase
MIWIETDVLDDAVRDKAVGAMDRYLAERVADVNREDVAAWRRLASRADWEAFKGSRIEALERSLGVFPDVPERVPCDVVGEIQGDGYVIDKVVFVSRPGIEVTANVWRPSEGGNGVGMVLVHSHHNPRTQVELQDMGAMWAKAGCAVMVMDQFAYGERREHPDGARHDYWNRYNTGVQLQLIGDSLMGWMVWDIRRGIDALEQTYGSNRIVVMGAVAGGGDPCAVVSALDERVDAAVPFNFGGPQPETVHPLPEDAELAFNYLGSGSWETTRNLVGSGKDGFLPWVIVGAIAPRKLIYAHEFEWDEENDPVWRRLQTIYGWYGAEEGLDWVKGFGGVKLRPPNASHCNNIGAIHRERIHAALERWLGVTGVVDQEDRRDERVLLGESKDLPPFDSAQGRLRHEDTKKGPGKVGGGSTSYLEVMRGTWDERRERLLGVGREEWEARLGNVAPGSSPKIEAGRVEVVEGIQVERFGVATDERVSIPVVVLTPPRPSPAGEGDVGVTVCVSGRGKKRVLEERWEAIEGLMEKGAVCLVDVRGVGELEPDDERTFRSRFAGRAATALMIGESVLGMQVRDLRAVIGYLRSSGYGRVTVVGWIEEGRGEVGEGEGRDDPDRSDVVARRYVDPVGVVLAQVVGVFEDVTVDVDRDVIGEVGGVLDQHVVDWPMDVVVPGMATLLR